MPDQGWRGGLVDVRTTLRFSLRPSGVHIRRSVQSEENDHRGEFFSLSGLTCQKQIFEDPPPPPGIEYVCISTQNPPLSEGVRKIVTMELHVFFLVEVFVLVRSPFSRCFWQTALSLFIVDVSNALHPRM